MVPANYTRLVIPVESSFTQQPVKKQTLYCCRNVKVDHISLTSSFSDEVLFICFGFKQFSCISALIKICLS